MNRRADRHALLELTPPPVPAAPRFGPPHTRQAPAALPARRPFGVRRTDGGSQSMAIFQARSSPTLLGRSARAQSGSQPRAQ
jgi:hypothetical protein